jgi:hypothetical protein
MNPQEILILIPRRTNRLVYIINHFLKELLGLETKYCIDAEKFKEYDGPKFHYGLSALDDEFFIAADDLIFERGIQDQELNIGEYEGHACLYPTYNRKSQYPFDVFSAAFYLMSRYEEYLPFINDKYGRFTATESIAFQNGFLQKPLIDFWAIDLGKKLKARFPSLILRQLEYNFIPSIDVDAAYAYKHKGFLRTIGGYLKVLRDMNFKELQQRNLVFLGKEEDPFDTFDYLFELHDKHNLKAIFFILFAEYGTNDKNTPTHNRNFRELLAYISDHAKVGIHPSYTSNTIVAKSKKEVRELSKCIHREIIASRQHFLILHLPSTYRNLINLGITDDYSMGYPGQIGFRASTTRSFLFYDLEMEYTTALRIHPFAAMEGTLRDYLQMNPQQAEQAYRKIIDEVKAVNGTYISIWHNESVGDKNRWEGWRQVYENMIAYALAK